MSIAISDVWPDRASYHPGESARIKLRLTHTAEALPIVEVHLRLTWLQQVVSETRQPVHLSSGLETASELPLELPGVAFRGYGVEARIYDSAGSVVSQRSTALDVLARWSQAPRYGFISEYPQGDTPGAAVAVAESLARYHINIAQFYDWMWRHYALMPPTDDFSEALGRQLSLSAVRARVAACRSQGIAAYGYAAVYGAEPEYSRKHPDEVVYDTDGKPYSLGEFFDIMNIAPGTSWRARIIATMREAVRDVPFDGLHLDQYGMPRGPAFDATKQPLDFPSDFASFTDEARAAIQQPDRDVGAIFNAVENWPIEQVANTTQDAVYIEVWPPYVNYQDLRALIVNARRLAPAKQVILAAYMKPLGEAQDTAALALAEAATRFTSATIWASGGSHLLLGEVDAALHEAYYVNHTRLRGAFAAVMRAYYDFVTRYLNVLCDLRLTAAAPPVAKAIGPVAQVAVAGQTVTEEATAGAVWAIARTMPGYLTVSLINLTSATSTEWNAPAAPPAELINLEATIRLTNAPRARGVYAATPDAGDGALVALEYSAAQGAADDQELTFTLPSLHYWTLILVEFEPANDEPDATNLESNARHD